MAIRVIFDGEELEFRPDGARSETRTVGADDLAKFVGWASAYETAVKTGSIAALLDLGRKLHGWLRGSGGWLKALNDGTGARELCFEVGSDPGEAERRLLDVPWELLATEHAFLAADAERPLVLTRRLGAAGGQADPAHGDLLLMFMAAAPFGAENFDYEREEAGILAATERLPMQLRVEESGCLEFLQDRIALEAPIEALHLSCHGTIKNSTPQLLLEDPRGQRQEVPASELMIALGDHKPPLVFLSACRTAEQPAAALPLALSLVRNGVANVLGWDGSVYDTDASDFARMFYGALARRGSVGYAAAVARQALLRALMSDPEQKQGRHWHLARVYLGGHGGGPVCAAGKPLRGLRRAVGFEEFLDEERKVPVAPARNFVGRRRQAQAILGVLRDKENGIGDQAGVLIHGMGRLGKSSLAARVANRLPRHKTVVVFRAYRAHAVLDRVLDALPARKKREVREAWAKTVKDDPTALGDALHEILEGPCSAYDPAGGKQPILLVVDDLEQILATPRPGQAVTLQDGYVPVLRAIIESFADVRSASHLLLTSRYQFVLDDDQGQDLTSRLADIPLPPMNEREQAKQLRAEAEASGPTDGLAELMDHCVEAGRGNPGLQSRLTRAALTDAAAAAAAVEEVERFYASGETPTGDLGDFFQQLTLDVYRQALSGEETALLRSALLFELAVPEAIIVAAGEAAGVEAVKSKLGRLEGLGLIDRFALEGGAQASLMVNALARPLFEALPDADQQHIASATVTPLADAWRDADGELPYGPWSLELVRIAELAGDAPQLLAEAASTGGQWLLGAQHDAKSALAVAEIGVAANQKAGLPTSISLLRLAAEAAGRIGEVDKQEGFLEEGLTREADEPRRQAMLWADWADRLSSKGQIQEAESWLAKALAIFTDLGDVRSIAITQGQIADILVHRGQYDEALRIRQEDQLPVYRQLGDVRSIAITQGKIADILVHRGQYDEALRIRQEDQLPVLRQLGDVRSIAITQGQIADILFDRGRYDEALRIRQKEELPVYRQLGDVRSIAHSLFSIAQTRLAKGIESAEDAQALLGELGESFALLLEVRAPDGIAAVGQMLGPLLAKIGQTDEARTVLAAARDAFSTLQQPDEAAALDRQIDQLGD